MLAITALLNASHTEGAELAQPVLPEIKVKAAAEKEPGYKADTSSTGLKFEAAIRDIPQSVSVVKEELIKSQNAFNLREALKNVSGLTIAAGEGGRTGDSITMRILMQLWHITRSISIFRLTPSTFWTSNIMSQDRPIRPCREHHYRGKSRYG